MPKSKEGVPRKDWKCPKCNSDPLDVIAKDGGSSVCSKCKTIFHYCPFHKDYSTFTPLMYCKCVAMNQLPKHKRRLFRQFTLKNKDEFLARVVSSILGQIPENEPKDRKGYDAHIDELIAKLESIQSSLTAIQRNFI